MRAFIPNRGPFKNLGLCYLGILGILSQLGCSPDPVQKTNNLSELKQPDPPAEKQPEASGATRKDDARTLLAECLNTYRNLERYQDSAQLVIQGS